MTKKPRWALIWQNVNADTNDVIRPVCITIAVLVITLASCTMGNTAPVVTCDQRGCSDWGTTSTLSKSSRARISQTADANGNAVTPRILIGGRPAGCPWKYCGCGLARHLGLNDKRLYRAWSWAEIFPRTSAASGMAAVRRGHVMLLQSHVGGTRWIVRDYNGGRHLSWIHERDVRGYVFVNPNGAFAQK